MLTDLHHGVLALLSVELHLEHRVVDGVVALGREVGDGAAGLGRQDDAVGDEGVLGHRAEQVAAGDVRADLWGERARLVVGVIVVLVTISEYYTISIFNLEILLINVKIYHLDVFTGEELPGLAPGKSWGGNTLGDVDGLGQVTDLLQRSLNTIIDVFWGEIKEEV